ncbi:nitrilase [Spongiactinospora rosea]|uniref:Nitrilase n=1 Tax=Spongiactinospora rosea TaxID=2248750 RepID=A0A366LVM6_9ACTN|nr:carbon-nitrogen hydrolase family protein [Spongiactinospora rosea]RBQ18005.1 nitrilase [Spongiactinospora rosea]
MPATRVAVIQAATRLFDPWHAIDLVAGWTARAAAQRARLVVFPESFVGGYPKGSDFGAVIGRRSAEGREEYRRYFESAVEVPGPAADALGRIAADAGTVLVVGVIERDGSTLYCAMLTFGPDGALLGKRRKLLGVGAERLLFGWGDASTLDVHPTDAGRVGTVMCWENLMPAVRMAMYAQDVQIYCAPTAVGTELDVVTARHIAREGRCFVLAANQVMRVADYPPGYLPATGPGRGTVISRGGSVIAGPDGGVLAGPVWDEQTMLLADLDLDEIPRWKYDFDVTGHFARPDLFRLTVDRSVRSAVSTSAG